MMSLQKQKLLYVITKAPYSNSAGQEALDAILIGASFEQQVSVLFIHDGVFQIKSKQQLAGKAGELKEFTKTYRALADFGVEECYVLQSSLDARGVLPCELIIEPQLVDEAMVSELIRSQYRVFTF